MRTEPYYDMSEFDDPQAVVLIGIFILNVVLACGWFMPRIAGWLLA